MAIATQINKDYPKIETVTQIQYHQSGLITIGRNKYEEKGLLYADKYFPAVFDYKWIEGNSKTALEEPNSIVLTESLAKKYFGNKNAIGQLINLENNYNLKVTGVIKDVPGNTHLPFAYLVSLETIRKEDEGMFSAFWAIPGGSFTYIVTPPNYDVSKIQSRIYWFLEKNWGKDI